jgi:hypothetical protein
MSDGESVVSLALVTVVILAHQLITLTLFGRL